MQFYSYSMDLKLLFNKMDIEQDEEYINQFVDNPENTLFISALDGEGIDKINEIIDSIEKIDRTPEVDEEELDYY